MILDILAHAGMYASLGPRFDAALTFVQSQSAVDLTPGRHEIDGDRLFVNVAEYQTQPAAGAKWEAHRRYADIQVILSGRERIDYAPVDTLTEVTAYDPETDAAFLTGEGTALIVERGMFAVFFPHDGHRPNLAITEPATVRKAVVKVLLEA
jgi:YhcH/YjgK/YiaL family protein